MQCPRHTDRSAVGVQAWTPGCQCSLLTDIDWFWSQVLCGPVGDNQVAHAIMQNVIHVLSRLRPPHQVTAKVSFWEHMCWLKTMGVFHWFLLTCFNEMSKCFHFLWDWLQSTDLLNYLWILDSFLVLFILQKYVIQFLSVHICNSHIIMTLSKKWFKWLHSLWFYVIIMIRTFVFNNETFCIFHQIV